MNGFIFAEPMSAVRATSPAGDQARPTSGPQGIFAQLLASADRAAPAPKTVERPVAREVNLPQDAAGRRRTLDRLGDTLDEVLDWAREMAAIYGVSVPVPAQTAALPQAAAGVLGAHAVTLSGAAVNDPTLGAGMSRPLTPDAVSAAEVQPSGGVSFAALIADRLGVVLQRFDRANGTDTVQVLEQNAASLPALTLLTGEPAESAEAFIGVVRGLLGLATDQGRANAALVPSSPLMTRVAGAQPLAGLIGIATAGPGSVTDASIPEGRAVEALREGAAQGSAVPQAVQSGFYSSLATQLGGMRFEAGTARVQLSPPGLGAVVLTVTRTAAAATEVTVRAENARVQAVLQNNAGKLAGVLRDAGVAVSPEAISFASSGHSGQPEAAIQIPGLTDLRRSAAEIRPATGVPDATAALSDGRIAMSVPEPILPRPSDVAPPSAPAHGSPSSHLAGDVTGQMRGHPIAEGTTRIGLSPQGLGAVEIDLGHDDTGALRITIRAENPAVLSALRDNREMLLSVLRDNGVSVQESALGFEEYGQGERQQRQAMPKQADYTLRTPEDEVLQTLPQIQAILPYGRIDIIT